MQTNNSERQRINLTVSKDLMQRLQWLSDRDGVTITAKTLALAEKGAELEEDIALSGLADKRQEMMHNGETELLDWANV